MIGDTSTLQLWLCLKLESTSKMLTKYPQCWSWYWVSSNTKTQWWDTQPAMPSDRYLMICSQSSKRSTEILSSHNCSHSYKMIQYPELSHTLLLPSQTSLKEWNFSKYRNTSTFWWNFYSITQSMVSLWSRKVPLVLFLPQLRSQKKSSNLILHKLWKFCSVTINPTFSKLNIISNSKDKLLRPLLSLPLLLVLICSVQLPALSYN